MTEVTYPSGYGTKERSLDELIESHCPVAITEPEFRRRLRHWLKSKNGLVGIGDYLPRGASTISAASAANRSFHQMQTFVDGTQWASAVDLVVRRPGSTHSSGAVPWHEVPVQGTRYAEDWGVHINVKGESWHMQCIEIDGWYTWTQNGRPRPTPNFELPCAEPVTDPVLVFDPINGVYGLWPLNTSKPLVSVKSFAMERRSRADNRWVWTGDAVRYIQGVILHKAGGNIAVDGHYGNKTKARVEDLQATFGETRDGLVGPKTWHIVDFLATNS